MWKAIASTALSLFVVLLFLLAGLVVWGNAQWSDRGPLTAGICLEVAPGSSMRKVSETLGDKGAISSPVIFRLGADYSGKTGGLKAGSFLVPEGASMAEIVDEITGTGQSTCGTEMLWRVGVTRMQALIRALNPETGRYEDIAKWNPQEELPPAAYQEYLERPDTQFRMVVAEGVTSWQVREALNGLSILDGEVAVVPEEGTLAPDSYALKPGDSAQTLIERMQTKQEARLAAAWEQRSDRSVVTSPEELLILASIIEKETGIPEERRQVAAVFTNRLEEGMRLQTDPTVIYGITKGQGVLGRGLRRSELDRETPWNTYVINGLPPTPIANPGEASLRAAVNPSGDNYLFFVADGSGGHAFARTLADHNRNVAKWREIEAQRNSQTGGN